MNAGIKIMMMPSAEEWDGKSDLTHAQLKEVEIEDLLPREKIEVDMDAIGQMLKGKRGEVCRYARGERGCPRCRRRQGLCE